MRSGENLVHWIQKVDFGFVLPVMARLPLPIGEGLARLRGLVQALFDYDWRSVAVGQRYIRNRTWLAMNIMSPNGGNLKCSLATIARFIHNSREEWQACLFKRKIMSSIFKRSNSACVKELVKIQAGGRGLVLISCHLDSFCLGMVLMGMSGLRVNVINTAMIEDPRIHPHVRDFFHRKYRSMESRMKGRMPYYQDEMPYFYDVLRKGETVTLMGDIPGSKSNIIIPFCGRRFRMPLGGWRMAVETNSLIGAYVCIHEGIGRYRIFDLPPFEPNRDSPLESLQPIYSFLESWIFKYPERWLAADLLTAY